MIVLNKNLQKSVEWIHLIEEQAGWYYKDDEKAFAILRGTLQELRDNLPLNNLAHFSAQLPLMIRGLLFEKWNPEHSPLKERKKEDFLAGVYSQIPDAHHDFDLEESVRAVFKTLSIKIDDNEVKKLKKVLPRGIRELMP